jgi:hypothetical protein
MHSPASFKCPKKPDKLFFGNLLSVLPIMLLGFVPSKKMFQELFQELKFKDIIVIKLIQTLFQRKVTV